MSELQLKYMHGQRLPGPIRRAPVMVTYMLLVEIVVGEVQYLKDTTLIELSVSMFHDTVAFIQDG